jgi:hypothetical protein
MIRRYVEVLAAQRPFPVGLDEERRAIFSCNYDGLVTAPAWVSSGAVNTSFEEDIAMFITSAGLGVLGSSLYIGPLALLQPGAGPYTTLIDTGGAQPVETHDGALYERISFQVLVRGASYAAARGRALAIWSALDGLRNVTVA